MIVHQNAGVQLHACCGQCFPQQMEIVQSVAVIEKSRQAVVPALHDVLRDTRQIESRHATHADKDRLALGWQRSVFGEQLRPRCPA
ncbi:hypothetical protein [Luteimonas deserti]|uniref:hypothetical protein n=1 Tax=Luteimonas deserti TaxID=2752306 RepID=UPI001F37D5F9|nr:hypothetical protein [Luteimonas deserti]